MEQQSPPGAIPKCRVIACEYPATMGENYGDLCMMHVMKVCEAYATHFDLTKEIANVSHSVFFTQHLFDNDDEEAALKLWVNGFYRVKHVFELKRFLRERGLFEAAEAHHSTCGTEQP